MDPAGRELPPGEAGEVWFRGPMVIPGYLAQRTPHPGKPLPPASGVRATSAALDADGYRTCSTGWKDMINRAGYKVFGAEVESRP